MLTRSPIKLSIAGVAVAAALVAGISVAPDLLSGGAADAAGAPTAASSTTTPTVSPELGSTVGYTVENATPYDMVYDSSTGKGSPPDAHLAPGATTDVEDPYSILHEYDSSFTYRMYDETGSLVGKMLFSYNNGGTTANETVTYTDTSGKPMTTLDSQESESDSGHTYVTLTASKSGPLSQVTATPGSSAEQTMLSNLCENSQLGNTCTFTPTAAPVATSTRVLLAQAYNPGPDTTQLQTEAGYQAGTTDSWSVSLSANVTIAKVVQLGISATYGQAYTYTDTFSTDYQIPIPAGDTGYIYGGIPETEITGTFTTTIGNTLFTLPGVAYTLPDKSQPVIYTDTYTPGDAPQVVASGVSK